MIDASSKPFAENIELTRKVVDYAHEHGVVVEAELGALAGIEDDVKVSVEESHYTHPEEVQEFVEKTGCDSLAIAIGTATAPISSPPPSVPATKRASWFRLPCVSISWMRSCSACLASPSCSTVLPPCPSSM